MKMTLFVMGLMSVGAFFSFILSIFFLFFPKTLLKMNELASKAILSTEEHLLKHRIALGFLLLLSGIFLAYLVYSTPLDV